MSIVQKCDVKDCTATALQGGDSSAKHERNGWIYIPKVHAGLGATSRYEATHICPKHALMMVQLLRKDGLKP